MTTYREEYLVALVEDLARIRHDLARVTSAEGVWLKLKNRELDTLRNLSDLERA